MSGIFKRFRAWWNADGVAEGWYNYGDTRDFRQIFVVIVIPTIILVICVLIGVIPRCP
jgi:hypothetical protein